jgi:hypothetical protein
MYLTGYNIGIDAVRQSAGVGRSCDRVLVETLLDRGAESDVAEAEAAVERCYAFFLPGVVWGRWPASRASITYSKATSRSSPPSILRSLRACPDRYDSRARASSTSPDGASPAGHGAEASRILSVFDSRWSPRAQ